MSFYQQRSSTGMDPNVAGLLCYLFSLISGIVFLCIEKQSHEVKQNALQAIALFGVFALAQLAIAILGGILGWIPVMGWVLGLLFSFISWALGILYLVVSILCMVRAYQGQSVQLPFITNFVSGWNNL
ncbi:MAG: DUF4870 domain-containing protein [Christensenellales bacterium]|jgi:uncharacterized membrane protein